MKTRVLVTGGTKSDVAAMAVLLLNIKEKNEHLFQKAIIFHDGIDQREQEKIKIIMDTEFIFYRYPYKVKNDCILNYFSPMLFCKYECFKLLNIYDEVVWTDYDVIIEDRLDELCDFSKSEFNIVVDHRKTIREMFYSEIQNKEIELYNLSKEAICTPLFAISKRIDNYNSMYDWCYKRTNIYENDLFLAEQCIFSLLMQEYNIDYCGLSPQKYACHPRDAVGGEKILHSYGQPKFWSGLENEHWSRLYQQWIRMGGKRYSNVSKEIHRKIRLTVSRIKGIRARK